MKKKTLQGCFMYNMSCFIVYDYIVTTCMEVYYSKMLHGNYRRYQQIELSGFHWHMPIVLYILWGLKDWINNRNRGFGYSRRIQGMSIKYMLMHSFGSKGWTVGTEVYLGFNHMELCPEIIL